MTAGLEYPQSKREGKQESSIDRNNASWCYRGSKYGAIPSYLPSGTPRSLIAKRTFQNEYDGGGDPHSVHSPDGRRRAGRTDGRTDERRYPSQYITVTALPLFWMRGVKRRPLGRSEQESSPMTKWKVRPTERKRRYRSKAGRV